MSLSDQLLLVVSEGGINFSLIREIVKKVTGYDNRKVIWSTLERLFKRGFLKKTHTKEGISFESSSWARFPISCNSARLLQCNLWIVYSKNLPFPKMPMFVKVPAGRRPLKQSNTLALTEAL